MHDERKDTNATQPGSISATGATVTIVMCIFLFGEVV